MKNNKLQSREELIVKHIHLVNNIVNKLYKKLPKLLDKDDMRSIGTLGLIEAVDNFNPSLNVKFASFAERRIQGNILDALRGEDALSRRLRSHIKKIEKAVVILEHKLGRVASDNEVADDLNIPVQMYQDIITKTQQNRKVIIPDMLEESLDTLHNLNCPSTLYEDKVFIKHFAEEIFKLTYRERAILAFYYYENLKLYEIANILNLHETRISQILTATITKLKEGIYGSK